MTERADEEVASVLRRIERRLEHIEADIARVREMAGPLIANPGKLLAKMLNGSR